jgi:poly(A) polymerase
MPHVTLVYPFVPADALPAALPLVARACEDFPPWEVALGRFERFAHRHANFTVWLAPEPEEPLVRLQVALAAPFPGCDGVARFARGFTPHLSVGQAQGDDALRRLMSELEAWTPLRFTAREVSVIVRGAPPDDVFRVVTTVALGVRHRAGP